MSAGLAALATILQGGSKIGQDVISDVNTGIRARNRDSVLRWSAEQSKIKKIEKDLAKAGMPLPNDPMARAAILPQFGADPAADKPVEEFLRSQDKQTEATGPDVNYEAAIENGATPEQAEAMRMAYRQRKETAGLAGTVKERAEAGQALGQGGSTGASERNTKRGWSSQTADAVRPRAIDFMNTTLGREERGTADIDQQEAELRKQFELASGYSSYLEKDDLPSMLKQIEGLSASRNARISSDNSIRGDKTQIALGIQGSDRMMEQTAMSAEARAQEGEENRRLRERIAAMQEGGKNARNRVNANIKVDKMGADDLSKHQESLRKQIADDKRIMAGAAKLKLRKFESVEQAAEALGADVAEVEGFFSSTGRLDFTKVQNRILANQGALDKANKEQERRVFKEPAAPGKATSEKPLPSGWVRGADGVMRKQTK